MKEYKVIRFPKTRVATFDICAIGREKHHIPALLEIDVTDSRKRIREIKRDGKRISFTAWLVKVIGSTIKDHENVAAYLKGKRELIVFKDVNISMIVEKSLNGQKIPIPLVIERVQDRSVESLYRQINEARNHQLGEKDIVLQSSAGANWPERLYYSLPGFIRRYFWRFMLAHPRMAYSRMGNVSVTSVGMMGSADGWFIPVSVHPISFGIGKVTKKPVVINDKIEIREILNMTVLMDHDLVDGAPMARFISDLSGRIEDSFCLEKN